MKCIIPGNNVRVFGRTIHCLSKIGEDLYIEPLDHGLTLRTVNSSRSAYACYVFAPTFFYHYDDGSKQTSSQQDPEENIFKCKITMKSCLSVFKSLATIEKTVEKCKIKLNITDARLIFTLYCKHGITKTYNLTYQETESLQAVFSKDLCPNKIVAQSKLLCDAVGNFQTSQEEVTLIVSPEKVCLKNYVDDEPDPNKVMHTEMALLPEEFDDYRIGLDTEVTFCLKELRAILAFADSCCLLVTVTFETLGKPIVFSLDGESVFEASFVLATLAEPGSTQNNEQPQTTTTTQRTVSKQTRQRETPAQSRKKSIRKSDEWNGFGNSANKPTQNRPFSERSFSRKPSETGSGMRKETGGGDAVRRQNVTTAPSREIDSNQDTVARIHGNQDTVARIHGNQDAVARIPVDNAEEDDECSNESSESFTFQGKIGQPPPMLDTPNMSVNTEQQDIGDTSAVDIHIPSDDGDELDFIPSTPPTKKVCILFVTRVKLSHNA